MTRSGRWNGGLASIAMTLVAACSDSPKGSTSPETLEPGPVATVDAGAAGSAGAPSDAPPPVASNGGSEGLDPDIDLLPGASGTGGGSAGDPDAGAPPVVEEPPVLGPLTLVLAGDSIVQTYADTPSDTDQAGWGQMLHEYFDEQITVDNRAIGGRTARRFIDEGRLDDIVNDLEPGNYLLVQFGTNDGNRTATYTVGDETIPYFLDPATDFKAYLQRYIDAARSRDAIPVLVTPTPRNSAYCTGGNGTGGHAAAMRELGEAEGVTVVDLNAASVALLRAICPAPTPEDFFLLRADGTVDGTHFQEKGARALAELVAEGLGTQVPQLDAHRTGEVR